MASEAGKSSLNLITELHQYPFEFDFFQGVRLLELAAAELNPHAVVCSVGHGKSILMEAVRFRALASVAFPTCQISAIESSDEFTLPNWPVQHITVSFMGLTGPSGVLPTHYTLLLIERIHHLNNDRTLRDFLDLFNHRAISYFFRAWEKYRFPFAYERHYRAGTVSEDPFTQLMYSIVGLGSPHLTDRHGVDDHAFVHFGGLFATRVRNAQCLEQILTSYFAIQSKVLEFQGHWLYLPEECQSSLPSETVPAGRNLSLGSGAVVGSRAWDVQSRIRIQLGPLSKEQFYQLLPEQPTSSRVAEILRLYLDLNIEFDLQLILKRPDVPLTRITTGEAGATLLGWDSWLGRDPASIGPATDAVFNFDP